MIKGSFFNSINGDRKYNAEDFTGYFESILSNGVIYAYGNRLQVNARSNMVVSIASGSALIKGYRLNNSDTHLITLEPADSLHNRIDRLVVELNKSLDVRALNFKILKGEPSSNPQAKEPIRNNMIYQLVLADILVKASSNSILDSDITDRRADGSLCGYVSHLMQGLNVKQIEDNAQRQIQNKINEIDGVIGEKQNQYNAQFLEWWDSIKQFINGEDTQQIIAKLDELKTSIKQANDKATQLSTSVEQANTKAQQATTKAQQASTLATTANQQAQANKVSIAQLQNNDSLKIKRVDSLGNDNKDGVHLQAYNPIAKQWEWINPPMTLNVEYALFDKTLGHSAKIYIKMIDLGVLPDHSVKSVHTQQTALKPIELKGYLYYGKGVSTPLKTLPHKQSNADDIDLYIDYDNKIGLRTYKAWGGNYGAVAIIKYTR